VTAAGIRDPGLRLVAEHGVQIQVYFIWAANGGAPKNPAWYQNLRTHPNTRIEVGSETIEVVAEEATGDKRDLLFARAAERYPQLAELARKTTRVIPMVVLTPVPST
jgi:deazaflavin-dependent oxidoreductase (nitroreductase family)